MAVTGRAVKDAEPTKRMRRVGWHRVAGIIVAAREKADIRARRTAVAIRIAKGPKYPGEEQQVLDSQAAILSDGTRKVLRGRLWGLPAVMAVIVAAFVLYGCAPLSAQGGAAHLRLAVPAYVFPGQPPLVALQTMRPAPGIVILNPSNGDASFDTQWQSQADQLRARGITVLGYVHTDEGTRPVGDVEASINNYLQSSPGAPHVSGIFIDEMATPCSAEAYYAELYQYIRQVDPKAFVVANPGTPVNICYLRLRSVVAQTFVTFEHDASNYTSGYQGNVVEANGSFSAGRRFPATEFWHLVYGASSTQMPQIVNLAAARHAGYLYVTDDNLPNPWDSVASYIVAEAKAMAGKWPR